ncbi:hypothetical protein QR680_000458 [Steinernema hermaphroditum]|uniref:Uncharacterized protein n=1 Tax=Steinernema hermaphroditum TaxID=289476 RepID=A0AA39GXG0_9BILA|nr:hypothetical protein QR680_000458 [Steinernema hermaphroditum]
MAESNEQCTHSFDHGYFEDRRQRTIRLWRCIRFFSFFFASAILAALIFYGIVRHIVEQEQRASRCVREIERMNPLLVGNTEIHRACRLGDTKMLFKYGWDSYGA